MVEENLGRSVCETAGLGHNEIIHERTSVPHAG